MADDPQAPPPSVPDHLTPQERTVYEQLRRAQDAIDAAIAALGTSRDARARALLKTVQQQAAGIQHVLEWESERRAVNDEPPRPRRSERD